MTKKQDHLPSDRNAELEKKLAEATRELEIEAVLEKVRSRSLAMHKSDELHEVVMLLAEKLKELNVNMEGAVICLPVDDNRGRGLTMWAAMAAQAYAPPLFVPFEHPYIASFSEAWKTGIEFAAESWGYEEKTGFWKWAFEHSDFRYIPEGRKAQIMAAPAYALSTAFSKHSAITIPSHKGQMLSEDEGGILKRFAKVFDQAYVRFLDLQKAEAQAREAQIEVALERTRTQSMLMQHSSELDDTLRVFHEQVLQLGIRSAFSFLWLPDEDKGRHIFWAAWAENNSKKFKSKAIDYALDRNEPATAQCLIDWKGVEPVVSYHVPPEGVEGYFAAWQELIDGVEQLTPAHFKGGLRYVEAFMKYGCFGVMVESPLSPEEKKILGRFAVEFERTYTRFLDLQKAEAQAREAQIEAALERVRSRTMGMQHTEELREVIQVIYEQLVHLGFEINNSGILTDFRETDDFNLWMADPYTTFPTRITIPYIDHPQMNCFKEGKAKGLDFLTYSLTLEEKNKWFEYCFPILAVAEEAQQIVFDSSGLATSAALLKNVSLYLINFSGVPYSDADNAILMRFGKVFEQTYTRFKDLEQAEEQAREGQIQLALERVRARTMAMQHSDELPETANLLFKQAQELGMPAWSAGYCNWVDNKKAITLWMSSEGVLQSPFNVPTTQDPSFIHMREAAERGETFYVKEVGGAELVKHYKYMRTLPVVGGVLDSIINAGHPLPTFQIFHLAYFAQGFLLFITYEPVPEAHEIFKRFAAVFEQTYTRFLDLQKSEAQAREAQIQLGLERVRAKAMAMQTSEELNELIGTVFGELTKLDFVLTRCLIMIFDPETKASRWWMANSEAPAEPMNYLVQNHKNPAYDAYLEAWKDQNLKWQYSLKGKVKKDWDDFLFVDTELAQLPAPVIAGMKAPEQVLLSASFNNFGCLTLVTLEPLSDEHSDIMLRFAKVFDMCYTRFNDLTQAEEQAKESKIQLALERVRARTMAMYHSEELAETAHVLFEQLSELGSEPARISIGIMDQEKEEVSFWATDQVGGQIDINFTAPISEKTTISKMHAGWQAKLKSLSIELQGKELAAWVRFCRDEMGIIIRDELLQKRRVHTVGYFSHGWINYTTHAPLSSETTQILERFATMFSYTYTRFLDLQKAEAQARESQIQLALERVRARTMAMQHSDELAETVYILFQQFKDLGENPDQATIGIINEEEHVIEYWVTMHGNQENHVFKFSLDEPNVTRKIYEAWKQHKKSLVIDLSGKALHDFMTYRASKGGAPAKKTEKRRIINVALFSKGLINVQSTVERSEESILLLERFAQVFEGTYTRFLDLKQAEAQARESQIEAALERVRSRTMAMYRSGELAETAVVLFQQLGILGISPDRVFIGIFMEDTGEMECWATDQSGNQIGNRFIAKLNQPSFAKIHKSWKAQEKSMFLVQTGKELEDYINYFRDDLGLAFKPVPIQDKRVQNVAFFSNGLIGFTTAVEQPPAIINIMERFAGVFNQTYTRFLDLQKAEAQAREAQIELSLERVRAKTMAMHTSEHVGETVAMMFDELMKLGIDSTARSGIAIIGDNREMELWRASFNTNAEVEMLLGRVDMTIHPSLEEVYEAWKSKQVFYSYELTGEDQENYFRALNDSPDYAAQFDLAALPAKQTNSVFFFPEGCVYVFTINPLSEDEARLFKRFAGVFGLTYRRYLDLQKAENQAKEAQIQLALERVRARTMAMQKSDELAETATVLFQQLLNLGISSERTVIAIPNEDTRKIEFWGTEQGGNQLSTRFEYDADATYAFREIYKAWQRKRSELTVILKGKNLEEHVNYVRNVLRMPMLAELVQEQRILYNAFFSKGWLEIVTPDAQSNETLNILERFSAVFDGTYTRFLDLQKSETQGRESQIQLALERVRARTMSMQKSDELREVIQVILDQLQHLNFEIDIANFSLNYKETDDLDMWIAVLGASYATKVYLPYISHPVFDRFNKAKKKNGLFTDLLTREEKDSFFDHVFKHMPDVAVGRKEFVFSKPGFARSMVFMKDTVLTIANYEGIPYSEAENNILLRFGQVFDQTYTRFNDLQLAENQAHEATIEAALERVRGRAMAMHNSKDLTSTASMVFTELKRLGIRPLRCGVGLIDKETFDTALYAATGADGEENLELMGRVSVSGHPVLASIYKHWVENKDYFPELHGKSLKSYYEQLQPGFKVPRLQHGKKMHGHFIPFSEGCLYAWAEEPLGAQDVKILKRFTSVIDLTFKRYMELQRSEANARDAIREASLDRVRAEIASMRTPKDLERITPLMCEELATLSIPFIRCGVFIIDEKRELIHTYLSTPDGRALAAFDLAFDSEGIGRDVLPAWRKKQIALVHWDEEEFATYTKNLVTQGTVNPGERYVTEHPDTSLDLHFLPFLQGMLYVGNVAPLLESELSVVQSLAAAFSTAYARYEDFNRLEAAKEQVDTALTELKGAQNKLIQSEKMASLGELTAGIAHEIQNPLNFVNNFSEVNQEMIDELEEELKAGNIEDALAIAADIKQNEEKINHHGKRADAIVKGMLEHSRAGTGQKQMININVLADEFLKLSYHGLRAKDKTFNAEMITHFDKNLPKANVVQQDIGRVLINLFNNAFYAVNQKAKKAGPNYKPTVEVETFFLPLQGVGGVKVRDNGNGIPDAIKDKIMQPFFTTKPTGEGTGLGLSLSYDIVVKGHGGNIQVNSVEGEGSEFIIQLPIN